MMNHEQIFEQLTDYVLGLLPHYEQRAVERHVAECVTCQTALQRERQLTQLVRSTLLAAPQPTKTQLRSLMPPMPQKYRRTRRAPGWQRRLAPVALVLLLFLGSLVWQAGLSTEKTPAFVDTAHAGTADHAATATFAPPLTIAQPGLQIESSELETETAVATQPAQSQQINSPNATPAPNPTPIVIQKSSIVNHKS